MKNLLARLLLGCIVTLSPLAAPAAEFTVQDLSGTGMVCGKPLPNGLWQGLPGCTGYGRNTLKLTVSATPAEFPLGCDGLACAPTFDLYLLAQHQGRWYVFDRNSWPWWQPLSADVTQVRPSFPWTAPLSFARLHDRTVTSREFILTLEDGYDDYLPAGLPFKEIEIYAAVAAKGTKVFAPGNVRKVWPE